MPTLRYSGQVAVATEYKHDTDDRVVESLSDVSDPDAWTAVVPDAERDRLRTLLDRVLDDVGDGGAIESATIRLGQADAVADATLPRVEVSIATDGDLGTLTTVRDEIASQAAAIGLEPDAETAIDRITIA